MVITMRIAKISNFLRMTEEGQLSLTNVAVLASLVNIFVAQGSASSAAILFFALLNYSGKKVLNHFKKPVQTLPEQLYEQTQEKIKELDGKISKLSLEKAFSGPSQFPGRR